MRDWLEPVNFVHLLCYAWERGDAADLADAAMGGPTERMADLMARLLSNAVRDLLRRGLDRGYREEHVERVGLRGRLDVVETIRRMSFPRARTWCWVDELVADTPANQIVKATLKALAAIDDLDGNNRREAQDLEKTLAFVSDIDLDARAFARVVLHGNNRSYQFPIDLCRLIVDGVVADPSSGSIRFLDVRNMPSMETVFEVAVRRFYAREQARFRVSARRLKWQETTADAEDLAFLPGLRTDILLESASRWIVVDTKFYEQTLVQNPWSGQEILRPDHLFQVYAYLQNLARLPGAPSNLEAVLLYPRVARDLDLRFAVHGFTVRAVTIDLRPSWSAVHAQLLNVLTDARPGVSG